MHGSIFQLPKKKNLYFEQKSLIDHKFEKHVILNNSEEVLTGFANC